MQQPGYSRLDEGGTSRADRPPNLSLLDAQAWLVIPSALLLYAFLQTWMGMNAMDEGKGHAICAIDTKFASWTRTINSGAGMCFVVNCVFQIIRIWSVCRTNRLIDNKQRSLIKVYSTLLCISTIAGSSQLLTFFYNHGGLCRDDFGVSSPAAQWAEWFVCVPFLAYLACAVEHKSSLDRTDAMLIGSIALMIFFGFAMTWKLNYFYTTVFLFLSFASMFYFMIVTWVENEMIQQHPHDLNNIFTYIVSMQRLQRKSLMAQLLWILPYFPLVYMLGMLGILSANGVGAGYMIGSVVGKLVFSSVLIDSHVKLQDDYNLIVTSKGISPLAEELSGMMPVDLPADFIRKETAPLASDPQGSLGSLGNFNIADFADVDVIKKR